MVLLRPEYTSRLLVQVRLDIYSEEEEKNAEGFFTTTEVVEFSAGLDPPSVHPSWCNLNDRMKLQNEALERTKFRILVPENGTVLIDDFPLNPKYLRRLPEHDDHQQRSWGQPRPPPKSLPINAVLIQYSDGSTRVHPSLYHLLLQRKVIEEANPDDVLLLEDEQHEHRRVSRFQDRAFTTLDKEIDSQTNAVQSSLLETDDEALAMPIASFLDEEELQRDQKQIFTATELDCDVGDLMQEKETLEELIHKEELWLESDMKLMHEDKDRLQDIVRQIRAVEQEAEDIRRYTSKIVEEQHELDTITEIQRIKLMKELRSIYPIQCKPEQHYFIRGIELPSDLHVGLVTEDEISAALGYICHSLVMMSKYLSIPLRYRIVCNSSRSAVQEDGSTILPLFQSRVVERDYLERGMLLLDRNVEKLAKSRNVKCGETSHILQKMKRIYDKVVDGR
jgi:predicted double-glycine peptidase